MLDLIIKNGEIIDGSGSKSYIADIGIENGNIKEISPSIIEPSNEIINAKGYIICPGFIDMHSHSDLSLQANPRAESKIRQGVTTEVVGHCGYTVGPINKDHFNDLMQYLMTSVRNKKDKKWSWKTQREFLTVLEKNKISVNIVSYVGYGTIRVAAMGFDNRKPTEKEMEKMKLLLENEMLQGIHGLSLGLEYTPNSIASFSELVEMAKIVAKHNGILAAHIRNEGKYLIESIKEVLEIAQKSGVKLEISHLKASFPQNWGKVKEAFTIIENAKDNGVDVNFDVYPYLAFGGSLVDILPPWVRTMNPQRIVDTLKNDVFRNKVVKDMLDSSCDWDNPMIGSSWDDIKIVEIKNKDYENYVGMTINEISKLINVEPIDVVLNLLIEEEGAIKIVFFAMCEEDLIDIMKHSLSLFGSDGPAVSPYGEYGELKTHPRYYGTYPRILGKYVREEKILSLEKAISKMTFLSASKISIKDRGLLKENYKADITIFNKEQIIDKATFNNPHQCPKGIKYVIVNGELVINKGVHTGALPGKVIDRL